MQRPPLFESDGFIYWKNRFETYVKSKDLDLWHVITYGDFPPIQNNPETKKDEIVPFDKQNDDLKKKLAKNNEAKMDDIPLVSVYTTRNVLVRGMLIPDAFLTKEIRTTDDFKESTPRAHRTPTVSTASPHGKKRKQTARESSSPQKSLKITIRQNQVVEGEKDDNDYEDRSEPESHKENPEYVDNDDDEEKVDEEKDVDTGSLETRTEERQTPIPTPPRSYRINLSSDKNIT
ncbi:hypothetical protein Tco_0140291 [Tanacetum coccineum]